MRPIPFLPLVACLSFTILVLAQDESRDLTQLLQSNKNLSEFTTLLTSYGDIYVRSLALLECKKKVQAK